MKTKLFVLLITAVFASEEYKNAENGNSRGTIESKIPEDSIVVKIEEDEYAKKTSTSDFIGVVYNAKLAKWRAHRWSKHEKRKVYNGSFDNESTAAHASDNLARKFMNNGERGHKLNFPDEFIEVHRRERESTSQYIGVTYIDDISKWQANRWSKNEKKKICYGCYVSEKTAARASDTLARKLMKNGEQGHKLNFPDDGTEVHPEREFSSEYIGVTYNQRDSRWYAFRHSKIVKKSVHNGTYKDEETAAHASDTLARKLMDNGEQGHKLNFPDDTIEVHPERKKYTSKYFGVSYKTGRNKWYAYRWSKTEKKLVYSGNYDNEKRAAHTSDMLAMKLMENGEKGHVVNFPEDNNKAHRAKRKREDNYQDN